MLHNRIPVSCVFVIDN